jgi:hypothetical protein
LDFLEKPGPFFPGAEPGHITVFIEHIAAGLRLQTQYHAGQRRFAAAALPGDGEDFGLVVFQAEVGIIHRQEFAHRKALAAAEDLGEIFDVQ